MAEYLATLAEEFLLRGELGVSLCSLERSDWRSPSTCLRPVCVRFASTMDGPNVSPPPLCYRPGVPRLGVREDTKYDVIEAQLHDGDYLVLYSDGIPEMNRSSRRDVRLRAHH